VATCYAQLAEPIALPAVGTMLVVQADDQGGSLVQPPTRKPPRRLGNGQKRTQQQEAVVTGLSTMAPYPRTPQAVVAAWLQDPDGRVPGARPVPVGKELRATWEGKAVALARLVTRAAPRGSALHVMLFLENTLQALFIFNGLRSRHCQRALLGYHYHSFTIR
jgi:hypothetical protein